MNKEVARINERELQLGVSGSWHDQYKDSAYVYIGNLPRDLTEGDVITIMSQYGEVMDVNLPRDKQTGKIRGFGFLMYEDQRSTVLAVDNLNGAKVLDRTIRVDHVSDYKQPKEKDADGDLIERSEQSLNARPELITDDAGAGSSSEDDEPLPDIDPDDPMRDYLLQKFKEDRLKARKKKSAKRANETPEERKERKRRKKEKKERERRAIGDRERPRERRRSPSPVPRRRDLSPDRRDRSPDRAHERRRERSPYDSRRSRTPPILSRRSPPRRDYRD